MKQPKAFLTDTEALTDNPAFPCPKDILLDQRLVEVPYFSFDNLIHTGQLVLHKDLVGDVQEVFMLLVEARFPISKVIPIAAKEYAWNDECSMQDDNTSAWNYRTIAGTNNISWHGYGRAIDINPKRNPFIKNGKASPEGAVYDLSVPGTILPGSLVVKLFKERGFDWGGDWEDRKDYQHFEKPF